MKIRTSLFFLVLASVATSPITANEDEAASIVQLAVGVPITVIGLAAIGIAVKCCKESKKYGGGGYFNFDISPAIACASGTCGGLLLLAGGTLTTLGGIGLKNK